MITVVTGDANRLSIRGVKKGKRYVVHHEREGWWIEPEPKPKSRRHGPITIEPVPREELEAYYNLPDEFTDEQIRATLPKKEPR